MPGFNQTGPIGKGPMTGRKMGRCTHFGNRNIQQTTTPEATNDNPNNEPGFGWGRRMGFRRCQTGRGFGMGFRNRFRGMD
ncbi:MAG: DUF5320 domain-containing protein [Bacteroidales bacterium]|nr:DUF5320 domain-containing protein [Bacteroidales bacterium]